MPSAKSYWEGVIKDVEKRNTKVRHPYPFSFPSPAAPLSLTKSSVPDDIKFKISPPTPLHKTYKLDSQSSDKHLDFRQPIELNKNLKLPPSIRKKIKSKPFDKRPEGSIEVKIYPAKSCPLHKREKPCKIFDDDISKFLQRPVSSVPKLPKVVRQKKVAPCEHRKPILSKSSSASSVPLKTVETTVIDEFRERRFTKPPKLGMASLLPSFAKQVSTDSSVGTRDSLDLEEELEIQTEPKTEPSEGVSRRNFLRVPNLSFVSSHPSFRKLSLVDSCDKEDKDDFQDMPVIVEEKYSITAEIQVPKKKTLTFKDQVLNENEQLEEKKSVVFDEKADLKDETEVTKLSTIKKKRPKTVAEYDKKYASKALDFLTKHKHRNFNSYPSIPSLKASLSSEESFEVETIKLRRGKSAHHKYQDTSIDLEEIQKNLRETAKKYLDIDHIPDLIPKKSEKSTTIRTSSRSNSGVSPVVKSNEVFAPSADALQRIPKTRLINRPKIDKCHSCIYKPITTDKPKIKRELPLSSLKSIVDNPPNFKIFSSSSSSSLDELFNFESTTDDASQRFDLAKLETLGLDDDYEKKPGTFGSKSDLRVSFDESNIADTLNTDDQVIRDKSPSPKLDLFKESRLSVQSSDRSKTSTPTKSQSSDSDGMMESSLPTSKHTAPCHKPLVWIHPLDQLRALKLKKATSLRAKAAALMEQSSAESDEEDVSTKEPKKEEEMKEKRKARRDKLKKKKKKPKPLVRLNTVGEVSAEGESEDKPRKMLRRVKTTFDLPSLLDLSKSDESEDDEYDESSMEEESVSKFKKTELLPLAEEILKHRAGSPPLPTLSSEDILEIVKECLKEDINPTEVFDKISKKFIIKLEEKCETFKDFEEVKYLRQGLNLFKALVDSRRYLKPEIFDPNLTFSQKQPPVSNTRQLRRILPMKTFDLVAPILNMPLFFNEKAKARARLVHTPSDSDESEGSKTSTGKTVSITLSYNYF